MTELFLYNARKVRKARPNTTSRFETDLGAGSQIESGVGEAADAGVTLWPAGA